MITNWQTKKLGEIIKLEYGKPLPDSKRKPNGAYPAYGANGEKDRTDEYYYNKQSIIIGRKGSAGEINLTEEKFWPLDVTYFVTFDHEKYNLKFLYYLLSNLELPKLAKGVKPGINRNEVYSIPTRIPLLSEQQRIVAILDNAFSAIEKAKSHAEQNLKKAKELFDSYLQNLFENKQENCKATILDEVCDVISKGSSPKWQGIKYIDHPGILFVTSENVGENTLLLNQRKYVEERFNIKDKKSILKNGDVLTNIVGASIGRTAIYNLNDIANINQAVCLIRTNHHLLFNEYLMYLLNSPFTKQHLHDNEVNNARANLSLSFFRNLLIPLPKLNEQKSIVNKIKLFHLETQKLEAICQAKINKLEGLKKSILQKTFSGELSTTNIDITQVQA